MVNRAPVGNPADILRFQFDQSVAGRAFLGKTLWLKGLPDRAMREVAQSVVDAQSVGHSLSLCYTLGQGACLVSLLVGDWTAAEHYATLLLDQATRHGLALWETMGRCFQGMVAMRHGKSEAGLALLQKAVTDLNDAGYVLYHTVALAELADALGRMGQNDRAVSVIDKALTQSTGNDERWCMAELLRIKAEILLLRATPTTTIMAEDYFSSLSTGRANARP
jgi:predicted ATPase